MCGCGCRSIAFLVAPLVMSMGVCKGMHRGTGMDMCTNTCSGMYLGLCMDACNRCARPRIRTATSRASRANCPSKCATALCRRCGRNWRRVSPHPPPCRCSAHLAGRRAACAARRDRLSPRRRRDWKERVRILPNRRPCAERAAPPLQ